ncbi:hypothetical protein [Microbacterium sp. APC 3901]|uniref:hypothetical protein n=1 Tax=Microbacterium sp. APC 3901 TaxID=3035192 RepID=UPI0025B3DC00|nr:hypothetical protein [Microbacterium sp. APC 3901]MDN3443399.1 hypothetical protein [Microbacterium sp. APC 3901]
MANQGKASTIAVHPARAEIEAALNAGEPYRSISAKFGVSRSSLSRFVLSRAPLARVLNDEPNVVELIPRMLEAADDAQALRRLTRTSGNAAARARAIKTEADILTTLTDRLGIEDVTLAEFMEQTGDLIRALREFALSNPEAARSLILTMRDYSSLKEVRMALRTLTSGDTK